MGHEIKYQLSEKGQLAALRTNRKAARQQVLYVVSNNDILKMMNVYINDINIITNETKGEQIDKNGDVKICIHRLYTRTEKSSAFGHAIFFDTLHDSVDSLKAEYLQKIDDIISAAKKDHDEYTKQLCAEKRDMVEAFLKEKNLDSYFQIVEKK